MWLVEVVAVARRSAVGHVHGKSTLNTERTDDVDVRGGASLGDRIRPLNGHVDRWRREQIHQEGGLRRIVAIIGHLDHVGGGSGRTHDEGIADRSTRPREGVGRIATGSHTVQCGTTSAGDGGSSADRYQCWRLCDQEGLVHDAEATVADGDIAQAQDEALRHIVILEEDHVVANGTFALGEDDLIRQRAEVHTDLRLAVDVEIEGIRERRSSRTFEDDGDLVAALLYVDAVDGRPWK